MSGTVTEPVQVSNPVPAPAASAADVAALQAAVADLKATITGTVPRRASAAVKKGAKAVAAKVPVTTVAKLGYGAVMGAGSAITAAPHVAAAWATVSGWL